MVSGFEVAPSALTAQASAYDDVAATVARIRGSLRGAGLPSTGRADTTDLLADALDALVGAVDALGWAATSDADHLRAAAAGYCRADDAAVRPG